MACDILYIIGKLLELRCLKWAHIAHLDIWNTSYGQKKGRESNCQFDSRPEKVGNRPNLLGCRRRATYRWKALNKRYNFALAAPQSEVCSQSYWAPKSQESQLARFHSSPFRCLSLGLTFESFKELGVRQDPWLLKLHVSFGSFNWIKWQFFWLFGQCDI
jgi:hypothetical protein